MDPALLTTAGFWNDPAPFASGEIPDIPALSGHVLFETSGSSGTPKWVALSKKALLVSAAAVNRHLQVTGESCWGLALPVNHVGGFGVAARAYEAACGLEHFARRWDAAAFRDWLEISAVTHTSLVPTQVHDLVKAGLTAPSALCAIVVGGGRLDPTIGQAARDLGWPVLASYGMTEAGSQIATQPLELLETPYHAEPIPLLPIWDAEVMEEDLLAIAGPALFSGYVIDGVFIPRVGGLHVTSDRAILENKAIFPRGRADMLVKILGELVDPEAIEGELIEISEGRISSRTLAVIAIPDKRAENLLVPVFENEDAASAAKTALEIYEKTAPGFRRLKAAAVIGEFPRTALGKLRRSELRTIYHALTNL